MKEEVIEARYDGKPSKIITEYYRQVQRDHPPLIRGEVCYCYVIYNNQTNLYKVGYTRNYPQRIQNLETSGGCKLKTILVIALSECDYSAMWLEQFILNYFKDNRLNTRGEWFSLNKKDISEIARLFYECEGDDIWSEEYPFLIPYKKTMLKQIG
jgi:hypothetical protein